MTNSFDSFENNSIKTEGINISEKISEFNKAFDSKVKKTEGLFINSDCSVSRYNISRWLGVESDVAKNVSVDSVMSNAKKMYNGTKLENGEQTLGLKKINGWKSDISSKTGYAAEVVSTYKENITNEALGNGIKTYRADDRSDLGYKKNDPYVDKIRVDSNNNVIERVQTKFVGKDAESCYSKLKSKKFDKYITDGKVDKIEIAKDLYDGVKECITKDKESLTKQLESAESRGDVKLKENLQDRIDKVNKLDDMVEQSNTTYAEAKQAAKNGRYYVSKHMGDSIVGKGVSDGLQQAKTAIMVTGAISTVDNISACMDGKITAEDAVKNIALETGTAAVGSFGVEFVSSTASEMMKHSSNQLIKKVGSVSRGNTAALVVSYGIEVHETVIDYANGTIDNKEFADEMARGAAKVAGGAIGTSIGSAAGPLGSYYGGQIGSEVGEMTYEVSKEAIKTGIDLIEGDTTFEEVSAEIKDAAIDKAEGIEETAKETVDNYKEIAGYVVEETGLDEKAAEVKETVETIVEETTAKVEENVEKVKTTVKNKATEVKEDVKATADKTVEKVKDYQQSAKELVSSTVNYAITSEAYVSAVEACEGAIDSSAEQLGKLETKAKEYADKAIEKAGDFGADAVNDVKAAINDFNIKNSLPF